MALCYNDSIMSTQSYTPKTLTEAVTHFANLDNCHEYMVLVKWPTGEIRCPKCGGDRIGNEDVAERLEDSVHPVVITHPLSGKKALFVNIAYTTQIIGWSEAETSAFVADMFVHCTRPQFVYEFEWGLGSIAFWDNRSTWHYACLLYTSDAADE